MNQAIHRTVCKIKPQNEQSVDVPPQPFAQYLEVSNIILLGDPGSGKTYTFEAASEAEKAKFLSVRQFLATNGGECEGQIIYLDGLDEFRSRVDDKNAILEVIKLLNSLGRPRLRLSCRVADWLGETDLSLFEKSYFCDKPYAVLSLAPLTEDEMATILSKKGIEDVRGFVLEAEKRGIEKLLGNPQTLIMLSDVVVRHGSWPDTKRELFEKSTQILLTEHNRERMGPGLGQYTHEELTAPAGAVCASILISDVAGISLIENNLSDDFPTYRNVPFNDLKMVQSCLMRRAFSFVDVGHEAVSYIHRMIAEFLAASWLAAQVRTGLPIRRVLSLIGIEGHPASELRGLHAWLAVLLPEHAAILIKNDPYGVLMYGDARSLSPTDRHALLNALELLSQRDPWFRAADWSDGPLGALSGPDMVRSFQRILCDSKSSSHLRSVVLDAIRNGPPLPETNTSLINILVNPKATYHERSDALRALLRMTPEGAYLVTDVFKSGRLDDTTSLRLKADILAKLYTPHFNPDDVVALIDDYLTGPKRDGFGEISILSYKLPDNSLPDVLDKLSKRLSEKHADEASRNKHEVCSVFSSLLLRLLKSDTNYQVIQLWQWLKGYKCIRGSGYPGRGDDIREWLLQNPALVLEMFKIALDEFDPEKTVWDFLYDFRQIVMYSLPIDALAILSLRLLTGKVTLNDKDCLLYQICGQFIFESSPISIELVEEFLKLADAHDQLRKYRDELCICVIPDWRLTESNRNKEYEERREIKRRQNMEQLSLDKGGIRSGQNLSALQFLALIYYGYLTDKDHKLHPHERLKAEVGTELSIIALEGFSELIRRSDLPSPTEIALLAAKNRSYHWWLAVLAGMDEAWQRKENLDEFSSELLKTALALAMLLPEKKERPWKERLLDERSDIVESVFEDIAIVGCAAKMDLMNISTNLRHLKQTEPWRGEFALGLLNQFPLTNHHLLLNLILTAISDHKTHGDLIRIAKTLTSAHGRSKKEQRAVWLSVGFLLDCQFFKCSIMNYAKSREWVIWIVMDFIHGLNNQMDLSIEQLEVLIRIVGERFPSAHRPEGVATGSHNPWDATQFVQNLIDRLSAFPDMIASQALKRLIDNNMLASYHDHLKHALASQVAIRREKEYRQPSWHEVIEALRGGRPANIADLHALTLDHLETLRIEIRQSNTDTYKAFWRCDQYGKIDRPEIEDICRDRLIELLKTRLIPLGLRIEPEGHMAADKRADIVILPPPGQKLPLELKRDTHEDIWEACQTQMERLYTHDPEASGYGIYVVFWFGDKRVGSIVTPPSGINPPQSPEDLEKILRSLIPTDKRHCLEAVVIDVTPPT
ncbi:MAG: hypothetical protein ABSE05_06970 [Syntrophales bacterium]|jgi:hypothetical protein